MTNPSTKSVKSNSILNHGPVPTVTPVGRKSSSPGWESATFTSHILFFSMLRLSSLVSILPFRQPNNQPSIRLPNLKNHSSNTKNPNTLPRHCKMILNRSLFFYNLSVIWEYSFSFHHPSPSTISPISVSLLYPLIHLYTHSPVITYFLIHSTNCRLYLI